MRVIVTVVVVASAMFVVVMLVSRFTASKKDDLLKSMRLRGLRGDCVLVFMCPVE